MTKHCPGSILRALSSTDTPKGVSQCENIDHLPQINPLTKHKGFVIIGVLKKSEHVSCFLYLCFVESQYQNIFNF